MRVLITGTSRGIGLELTRQALRKGYHVMAVARKPTESVELQQLLANYPLSLEITALDLELSDSAKKIREALSKWSFIDVIINNAGIYQSDSGREDFEKSFLLNAIVPFEITHELSDLLRKSTRPLSLQITSQMGSISDNTSGGSYSYRSSKAALNMIFKSLSIDEKWLISLLVHPGWVQTRMGGEHAPVTPLDSATGIWGLIEKADKEMSGTFLNYRGETIFW